jgi:hypothetical protein
VLVEHELAAMKPLIVPPQLPRLLLLLLLPLATRPVAAPCDFVFEDDDGDEWDLETLAGIRTTSGPAPTGTFTYKFDICANIAPIPSACNLAGILGTVAARYVRRPRKPAVASCAHAARPARRSPLFHSPLFRSPLTAPIVLS